MAVDVVGAGSQRLVTKANTAGPQTQGSANFTTSSGSFTAWGQIDGNTSTQLYLTSVSIKFTSAWNAADVPVQVQIGRGSSGAEVVIAEKMIAPGSLTSGTGATVPLDVPLRVSSGSRIAVRLFSNNNGAMATIYVTAVPYTNVEGN